MATERVKELQSDLKESVHKIWLAGLGALSVAERESSKLFKELVKKGEEFEERGKERWQEARTKLDGMTGRAKDRAEATIDKVTERADEVVTAALKRAGVPTRDELAALTQRVEELTRSIDELRAKPKPRAKATARKGSRSRAKGATSKS